jgi:hypothetical protein
LRKIFPYIILCLVVLLLAFLASKLRIGRTFDDRLSFNKNDRIPYGLYVAYHSLSKLFPDAEMTTVTKAPGNWNGALYSSEKRSYIVITSQFLPDEMELNNLTTYARTGNDIFISARNLNDEADKFFQCRSAFSDYSVYDSTGKVDSMWVSLSPPAFMANSKWTYPGLRFDAYFSSFDSTLSTVIGRDAEGRPNFLHFRVGDGNVYLNLAPAAFTNYFLLHKDNIRYFESSMSVLDPESKGLIWDDYFHNKNSTEGHGNSKPEGGTLSRLMSHPSFSAAIWLLLILLLIFAFQEMRRKQRIIPEISSARNESLEFVKTIGRLYYEKGDHQNLGKKMSSYFLEHIRNRYKLQTTALDDRFISTLHLKSGYPEPGIREITVFIKLIEDAPWVSHQDLADFHRLLENFYRQT